MLTRRSTCFLAFALAVLPTLAFAAPLRLVALPSGALAIDSGSRSPMPPAAASLAADTLRQRAAALDSLLGLRTADLARTESTVVRLRDDSLLSATAKRADSSRIAILRDSLRLFTAFDSQAIRLDSMIARDTLLRDRMPGLRTLVAQAAYNTGLSVHQRQEVPGFQRCATVRAELSTRNDSTWLRLWRGDRSYIDSIAGASPTRLARLEREVVRAAFGPQALPPEPIVRQAPWVVRAGIVAGTALLAVIAMVSLW
jgi:hypothetical protein